MRVLLIGNKGMLGTDLLEELKKNTKKKKGFITKIFTADKNKIDITNKNSVKYIEKIMPDILINCAAYTNVDLAETEKEKCHKINCIGIENIVKICKKHNICLVQISTDYVFDGKKEGYNENDKKNPLNYYGKTKSIGEDIIIKNLKKYFIVRTSWLFGKDGKNFVDTIIDISKNKEIEVVDDQKGSPTYTKDLSIGIIKLIKSKKESGIYHITNSGSCTWFEFANEIIRKKKIKCKINQIKTEKLGRPAKRPKYSVLINNKTSILRPWKEALIDYMRDKK